MLVKKEERLKRLKNNSGNVVGTSSLVSFLYTLMRDHLTPGKVEEILQECLYNGEFHYSNGWLAKYAKDVAVELDSVESNTLTGALQKAFSENENAPLKHKKPDNKFEISVDDLADKIENINAPESLDGYEMQDGYGSVFPFIENPIIRDDYKAAKEIIEQLGYNTDIYDFDSEELHKYMEDLAEHIKEQEHGRLPETED